MLKPLAMQRVNVQVLRDEAPLVAQLLAQAGAFDPETTDVPREQLPDIPGERFRDLYRDARSRLDKILGHCALGQTVMPAAALRPVDEAELERLDAWLREVWAACSRCQEGLRRIEDEQKRVQELLKAVDNFAALDLDLNLLARSKRFLDIHVGTVPRRNVPRLRDAAALAGYVLSAFLQADELEHVVVAGPRGREEEIRPVLQAAGWRALDLPPELRAHPEQARRALQQRLDRVLEETDAQCQLIEATQQEFRDKLVAAQTVLAIAAPYAELGEALRGRGGLALVGGWVPKRDLPRLQQLLAQRLDRRFVLTGRDPRPGERARVPSVMRHPRLLRPYAELVKNYGVPRYGEIDPTILFALSFIIMFGMMFGDVGQGAVFAVLGFALHRVLGRFTPFVVAAGLSSMVFGFVYGSVFGFEEVIHPLWMSPLSDPMRMLTLALYWGIGFILVVTGLTIYNRLVDRRYADALFDGKGLAGLLFYTALVYAGYRWVMAGGVGVVEAAAIIVPFLFVLGYKWHEYQGATGERVLVVFIEGFETILSYLANTLSFLRVAAFSLNHVALAIAVFTIADMMGTTGHWIAVVVGNVFIMVLEGAIVTIQALRLEYYEGFSRFFSGDGREFRPLSLGSR